MPKPLESQPSVKSQSVTSSAGRRELYGYALWKYGTSGWQLAKDCSVEGAVNSGPPETPGLFPGQIRATPSVAA